jgi:periplasmic protein TonB
MFNPKSTIYQTEWLDLVFADRNKSYGAYELRQNYNKRLLRALMLASSFVMLLFAYPVIKQFRDKNIPINQPIAHEEITVVDLLPKTPKPDRPAPEPAAPASAPLRTIRSVPPVVVSTPVTEDPPRNIDLITSAIGTQTTDGTATNSNVSPVVGTPGEGSGMSTEPSTGDEPVNVSVLEKYPEFPGGMEGFAKYLQKNLRYPMPAIEAGITGKVFVTFIVERDGRLTDIKVVRGLGYGCDQEAERVLKKSPVWSPGIQNNRAVRVQYTIPLMFQLSE